MRTVRVELHKNLVRTLRDVLGNGVAQAEFSLFVKRHEGDADNGLCLRVELKNVVPAQESFFFNVAPAESLVVDYLSVAPNVSEHVGHFACVYLRLKNRVDIVKRVRMRMRRKKRGQHKARQ